MRTEFDMPLGATPQSRSSEKTPNIEQSSQQVTFAWLEITEKCQLQCQHCYVESGPQKTHGSMSESGWKSVISQLGDLGTKTVQFIGGEPMLHPSLPRLIDHALENGLSVEVYSNLVHVPNNMWDVLAQDGVSLATSYYSDKAEQHDAITTRRGSYARTRANVQKATDLGIPIRAGVIGIEPSQRVEQAQEELIELGVTSIGFDHLRQVGRGERDQEASVDQLCGNCASGVLVIKSDGSVNPCVFARWDDLTVGNVQEESLHEILNGGNVARVRDLLSDSFAQRDDDLPEEQTNCPPRCNPCAPPCRPQCQPNCKPSAGQPCAPERKACPPRRVFKLEEATALYVRG